MSMAQQHLKNIPKSSVTSLSGLARARRSATTAAFRNRSCNDFRASCCCPVVDLVRQGVIPGVSSAYTCGTESRDASRPSLRSSERRGGRGAPRQTATCGSFLVTTLSIVTDRRGERCTEHVAGDRKAGLVLPRAGTSPGQAGNGQCHLCHLGTGWRHALGLFFLEKPQLSESHPDQESH